MDDSAPVDKIVELKFMEIQNTIMGISADFLCLCRHRVLLVFFISSIFHVYSAIFVSGFFCVVNK